MKTKLLLLFSTFSVSAIAQTVFTYAPELGFATTGVASCGNTSNEGIAQINTLKRYQPLNSLLVGLHAGVVWREHYRFLGGIQYQQLGDTRETYQDGYRPIYDAQGNLSTFYHARYEGQAEQTLHKIALPISASYIFGTQAVQPFVQVNYRLNYFIDGKYQLNEAYTDDLGANFRNKTTFNPFTSELERKPVRWQHQVGASAGVLLFKDLEIALTYHYDVLGGSAYRQQVADATTLESDADAYIPPQDFLFTVRYYFTGVPFTKPKKANCPSAF